GVRAPFGVEVVGVNPARVRVTIEPTVTAHPRILPAVMGMPADGFKIEAVSITPESVKIEGPANRVKLIESILTTTVDVTGKQDTVRQTVDLNILDPRIRIAQAQPIHVEVRIGRK